MTDTITLLKTMNGRRMTKLWKQDGTIEGYEDAKNFKMRTEQVASLDELGALLKRIEGKPDVCLIRGAYVGAEQAEPAEEGGAHPALPSRRWGSPSGPTGRCMAHRTQYVLP